MTQPTDAPPPSAARPTPITPELVEFCRWASREATDVPEALKNHVRDLCASHEQLRADLAAARAALHEAETTFTSFAEHHAATERALKSAERRAQEAEATVKRLEGK